ncbi:AUR1 (YKL004W) [Zygosaccharomyces parabailii]|uniref:ZYBA0S05-06392g1_1 n=1 Tax=Zygosaccharomyces bailii (strain CLIB 213 / ATCC 58445 / CBS 680 / BCRC 21525 / NBRC 1098 / NCYC 1416 / NRRL Y-2227) TaxID=1333698 RepID=A0A8J2T808_ZYGB2|nr:AUR1 (YKL004W) [Zygosaccharomyces parabailii]CDF89992.1 ZYBA0S05-06392g1_1 [Zygosaccharomyces bailii CLIB 213]CDH17748.1 probable Inositol phosphorylceramide synthase catalytic subunit AUR1 [Zygosaccharomyces bailii ISA1307]SJM84443.1 probable Inositol phosphorylceramide synthase catalytic subunit AUR1 [Zygosaccharomyces bailii]
MSFFSQILASERPVGSHVADLETSLDPRVSLQKLRRYRPTLGDLAHYTFLGSVLLFVFIEYPANLLIKLAVYSLAGLLFLIPATSQFFFSALPILTWLALYFTSSYFPAEKRPRITVKVLPATETILYGDNLSDILAASTNSFLDILAWLPYGLFHFGAPFVVAAVLFVFGPPTVLRGYAHAFGYVNLIGVIVQNGFPAAPPWYKLLYGLKAAHYGMHGSPGGLARIDELLGISIYTNGFSNSSVIFGAFPSLHSGCATMEALFFSYCFPKLKPLFITYVCWLWWSTMYLTHHYFVDLVFGSVLSLVIFTYTKYTLLPLDTSLFYRWSYTTVDTVDMHKVDPLRADPSDIENVPLSGLALEFELNSMDESSRTPSIFDGPTSVSRSSATSNTSLTEYQTEYTSPSPRLNKQRFD